jgi:hypothetical protein
VLSGTVRWDMSVRAVVVAAAPIVVAVVPIAAVADMLK